MAGTDVENRLLELLAMWAEYIEGDMEADQKSAMFKETQDLFREVSST